VRREFVPRDKEELAFYQELGRRLAFARSIKKLSQRELGRRAGITTATMCMIEAGVTRSTIYIVLNLARALGVPLSRLVDQ